MSDSHAHDHAHEHAHAHGREYAAPSPASFRFELFADGPSAQAAFNAAFPAGSRIEPALQALVNRGVHCKSAGPGRVAGRYVENRTALAGWCWHVALDADSERLLQRVLINSSVVAT